MRRGFLLDERSLSPLAMPSNQVIGALLDVMGDAYAESSANLFGQREQRPPAHFVPFTEEGKRRLESLNLIQKAENEARANSFIPLPDEIGLEVLRFALRRNETYPTLHPCDWKTLYALMRVSKHTARILDIAIAEINDRWVLPWESIVPLTPSAAPRSEPALTQLHQKKIATYSVIVSKVYGTHWRCTSDGRCEFITATSTIKANSWHHIMLSAAHRAGIAKCTDPKKTQILTSRIHHERNYVVSCSVLGESFSVLTASGLIYYITNNDHKSLMYVWEPEFKQKPYRVVLNRDGGIAWSRPKKTVTRGKRYNDPDIINYTSEVYMWSHIDNNDLTGLRMSPLIRLRGFDTEGLIDVFDDPDNAHYTGDDPANNYKVVFQCLDASAPTGKKDIKITQAELAATTLTSTFTDDEIAAMARLMGLVQQ